jgi:hypothetical protein
MAISIHSNRFRPGYHNMSAPPRTSVELKGCPVTGKTAVFSFTFALSCWKESERLLPGVAWKARNDHVEFSARIRGNFADPAELFRAIGEPIAPDWQTDFLIGFRLNNEELKDPPRLGADLCDDPRLCAGVLTRCIGSIYFSRRSPVLTWETLLSLPIGFDDPLVNQP